MFWYILSLIVGSLIFLVFVFMAFNFRKDRLTDVFEWLQDNKKIIFKLWLLAVLIITILLIKPLWKTTTCQFDGFAANTETSYSWYKGQCLYKSKTGAWLPLGISRDQPEGSHDGS